jgi:tRNA (adenine57-N1/adenine58-N1)-methyltransferase catalytic subunit
MTDAGFAMGDSRRAVDEAPDPADVKAPDLADDAPESPGDQQVLRPGETVLLVDTRQRRYLVVLAEGGEFHTHSGPIPHDGLIGQPEGTLVRSARGGKYVAWRPTLSDFVLSMPRGAQVIYPKDLGALLMLADVRPGDRVFETGLGSGALSMALLRAGAQVTGYEIRADFLARATKNVGTYLGDEALSRYDTHEADSYAGIAGTGFDRVLLDLPEPWQVVPHAVDALRPGGIIVGYTPSVVQVMTFRNALDEHGFRMLETLEVLHRGWHVEWPAVRPNHRMNGHTGFLTAARLPSPSLRAASPTDPDPGA